MKNCVLRQKKVFIQSVNAIMSYCLETCSPTLFVERTPTNSSFYEILEDYTDSSCFEDDSFLCDEEAIDRTEEILNEQKSCRYVTVEPGTFVLLITDDEERFEKPLESLYDSLKDHARNNGPKNAEIALFGPSGKSIPDYDFADFGESKTFDKLASWYKDRQSKIYNETIDNQSLFEYKDIVPVLVVLYGLSDRQIFCQPIIKDFINNLKEVKCSLVVASAFQLEIPWEQKARVTDLACFAVENNKILSHLWTQFGNVTCTESEFSRLASRNDVWTWIAKRGISGENEPNIYDLRFEESLNIKSLKMCLEKPCVPKVLFRFDKSKPHDESTIWINSCLHWHYDICNLARRNGSLREEIATEEEKKAWKTSEETNKFCAFVTEKSSVDIDEKTMKRKISYATRLIYDKGLKSLLDEESYAAFDRSSEGFWIEEMASFEYPSWSSFL